MDIEWVQFHKMAAPSSTPNILLVVLDSVRAKNTSLHGYNRETTPFMDSLASISTVYTEARSPGIHSVARHASIWSGQPVEEHGVIEHESQLPIEETVWNTLNENGYSTGLFTPNAVVSQSSNLSEPFDWVADFPTRLRPYPNAICPDDYEYLPSKREYVSDCLNSGQLLKGFVNGIWFRKRKADIADETGDIYANLLIDWIDDQTGPWGACLNIMDAHYPYFPEGEHDIWSEAIHHNVHNSIPRGPLSKALVGTNEFWKLEALETLYDGCIRQCDAIVEKLVEMLRAHDEFDNTLLVVTSDHGEGFGEQSVVEPEARLIDHSWGIDESVTHVPLLVKEPGQTDGRQINDPATLQRFRPVIENTLNGDVESFVPDGPVLCSTFRLKKNWLEKYDGENMESYRGPWRAVYTSEENAVVKQASRRDNAIKSRIDGTTEDVIGHIDRTNIEAVFDSEIEDRNIAAHGDISEMVENRLHDLGYAR